jgi:hypothetical protein
MSANVFQFKISPFFVYMLNTALPGACGCGLALFSNVHEQVQSNKACNIFNFVVGGVL